MFLTWVFGWLFKLQTFLKQGTVNALVNTVRDTWDLAQLNRILTNVFDILCIVLCNILKGNGCNDCVEDNRGKQGKQIKIKRIIRELENDKEDEVIDLRTFQISRERKEDNDDIFDQI